MVEGARIKERPYLDRMLTVQQRLLPLLSGWALCCSSLAQPSARIFHHLTIADGLSQNSVNAVIQDQDGFLWFGTQDGLDRYDGRTFMSLRGNERRNSLANNYIWALHEDSDGAIWIGTFGGGLDRYDPATGRFTHHRHTLNDSASLPSDRIFSIVEDAGGMLWLGTNNGLAAFDPATGRARRWFANTVNEADGKGHFTNALALHEETLWLRTDSGLTRFDTRTASYAHFRLAPYSGVPIGAVQGIVPFPSGVVVLCEAGLLRIDEEARADSLLLSPAEVPGADPRMVFSRLCIQGEDWWIGSNKGLVHWHRPSGRITLFRHDATDAESLVYDQIQALLTGRGGELWIATRNGLDRLDRARPLIELVRGTPGRRNALSDRSVTSFAEGADGSLWIGTPNGLNHWVGDSIIVHRHDPGDPQSLPSDYILSLFRDREARIWVGTRGGGLARLDPDHARPRFKSFAHDGAPGALNSRSVHCIAQDHAGTIWIGTSGGGLCRMDGSSERFTCYPHTGDDRGPAHPFIYSITEDSHGHLWLGTPTGGLNLFDPLTERFVAIKNRPDDRSSLSNDIVLCTFLDQDTLWVGTANGLNRLMIGTDECERYLSDPASARLERYSRSHGLPNEVVYGILPGAQRTLWLSTNLGLAEVDQRTGLVTRTLSTADGLQNDEFNQNAFLRCSDGSLLFGGVNGLNRFMPASLSFGTAPPPVRITRLLLANEPVPLVSDSAGYGFALPLALHRMERLALSWREKVIGFEFAALSFIAPGKNRYRYMLDGFDKDWTDAGTRGSVTYTNLDPGEYVLRVQGCTSDGTWNEQGASLALSIAAPPWRTWYAYALYAAMLLGLGYAWYRYRLREATRELETTLRIAEARSAEREEFRRRSSADFHDESGAKLTRINLHTGLAKQQARDPAIRAHLEHIEQAQRELSAGIRDLIWSMDPGKDSLHDVLDRLHAFALPLFDGTETRFRLEGRDDALRHVRLDMEERRAITLIMKEALNNCAKHAHATHCTLSVSQDHGIIEIALIDDGLGFGSSSQPHDGYGMRTMPERARAIGAQLSIRGEPGNGTIVTLRIPTNGVPQHSSL